MVRRSALIEEDFKKRLAGFRKSRRDELMTLAGMMLGARRANMTELAAALPREIGAADRGHQYIERRLRHEEIDANAPIKPYALQAREHLGSRG